MSILEERWADITINLVIELSKKDTLSYNTVLTVVDQLIWQVYFWPTYTTVMAEDIAQLLLEYYLPLYRVLHSIITDCDPKFIS